MYTKFVVDFKCKRAHSADEKCFSSQCTTSFSKTSNFVCGLALHIESHPSHSLSHYQWRNEKRNRRQVSSSNTTSCIPTQMRIYIRIKPKSIISKAIEPKSFHFLRCKIVSLNYILYHALVLTFHRMHINKPANHTLAYSLPILCS